MYFQFLQFNQVIYGLDENLQESVIISRASNQEQPNTRDETVNEIANINHACPTTDLEIHSYENQAPNTRVKRPGSKENTTAINLAEGNENAVAEYEACAPSDSINKVERGVDKNISCSNQNVSMNGKPTESQSSQTPTYDIPDANKETNTGAGTGLADLHLLEDDQLMTMPPPSPCKTHSSMAYKNVPKYAKPWNSETKINETGHGYVNLSDDMKLCTKDVSTKQNENKSKKRFPSDPDKAARDLIVDRFDSRYVNAQENLERPPRYDETSFKLRQANFKESDIRDIPSKPYYVNVTETNHKSTDRSMEKNDLDKSEGNKQQKEHSSIEDDMYLSMNFSSEQDTYIPVENPENLNSYERKTLQKHSVENRSNGKVQIEDDVFSDGYVDTQPSCRLYAKAVSCDSVYSYADPQLVCNLYHGSDRITKVPYSKPRSANRSKTFGAADSKDRPYKIVKSYKRFDEDKMALPKMLDQNSSVDYANVSAQNNIKHDDVLADYVNTRHETTDISKGRSKISKIPISTRRRSSSEINGNVQASRPKSKTKTSNIPIAKKRKQSEETDTKINENDKPNCAKTDEIEHDYENQIPKRCIKPPDVRKLKAPAKLPKPKLLKKPQHQESTNA